MSLPIPKRFAGQSAINAGYHNHNLSLYQDGNVHQDVSHTSLSTALTYLGTSSPKTLDISSQHRIASNTVIPSNISVRVLKGGSFDIASGVTLTINGAFHAGPYQVFSGAGSVVFGRSVTTFLPQWWGATGDGATDDTAAFVSAFTAVGLYGGLLLVPKPSSAYLISSDIGLQTGTTPVHVLGEGSKIKQATTASAYNMFRYRSNMVIDRIELEGYIQSGTSYGNVVPQDSYGFRAKDSGASVDGVLFRDCISHDIPFDGWYVTDANGGGHVVLKNCSGYDCLRNDLASVGCRYIEVDGGVWSDDQRASIVKNASIDFEPESTASVHTAIAKNLICYQKVTFSGDAGTFYNGYADNLLFDGTLYGDEAGLSFGHLHVMRLGHIRHVNGAEYFYIGAKWYEGGKTIIGRFVTEHRTQPQGTNLVPDDCSTVAGWDTHSVTGSATATAGVAIGDRFGIRMENSGGGSSYLRINLPVTVGRKYSFGCLIRADTLGDTEQMGIYVRCNGAAGTPYFTNGPTAAQNTERICGGLVIPTGTTSLDLYIGSESSASYDIIFSDIYFCEGIVDNETASHMFWGMSNAWAGAHEFVNNISISNTLPEITLTDTDAGDTYGIRNSAGTLIIRNSTDARTEIQIDGGGGISLPNALASSGTGIVSATSGGQVGRSLTLAGAYTFSDAIILSSTLRANGNVGIRMAAGAFASLSIKAPSTGAQDILKLERGGAETAIVEVQTDSSENALINLKNSSGTNRIVLNTAGTSTFSLAVAMSSTLDVTGAATALSIALGGGEAFDYNEGTFTATLTGVDASVTGTARYVRFGKAVVLYLPDLSGTSNTTACTLTGVPADIFPARVQEQPVNSILDNGSEYPGNLTMATSGVITLSFRSAIPGGFTGTFTNSGTKGFSSANTMVYNLL